MAAANANITGQDPNDVLLKKQNYKTETRRAQIEIDE
jgi:hypothetical protein